MPIRMRSVSLHGNVSHYILLSANAGVKPVCSPHVATMGRLGKALESPSRRICYPGQPGVGTASSLGAVGWIILCWEGQPHSSGGSTGPIKTLLVSSPSPSHLGVLLVASSSGNFHTISVRIKC